MYKMYDLISIIYGQLNKIPSFAPMICDIDEIP